MIQFPHGISIYHTYHITATIIAQCFPDTTEIVNSSPTPFKADRKFEISLAENLPGTPADLRHLQVHYLGKFSSHIVKLLHIIQYTHPTLVCPANCLSSYAADPATGNIAPKGYRA